MRAAGVGGLRQRYDFFFTACPLSWYGFTFYGTVDVGGTYQTHGDAVRPKPSGRRQLPPW